MSTEQMFSLAQTGLVTLGALGMGALLGANAFEAVVDVPNWRQPEGLRAYRTFIKTRNAGHFYRVLSPLTILTTLAATIVLFLAGREAAPRVGAAAGLMVAAELLTVIYFFPRNKRLFFSEMVDAEKAGPLVRQWSRANSVRLLIVTAAALLMFSALR